MMLQKQLLEIAKPVRNRIVRKVAIGLFVTGTYVAQGVLIAHCVAGVFAGHPWEDLAVLVMLILACLGVRALLTGYSEYCSMLTAADVKIRLRRQLYDRLLHLGPGYMGRSRTGAVQSAVVSGVEALEGYLGYYLPQAFICLIGPVVIIGYVATVDASIAALIASCVLFALFAPTYWRKLMAKLGMRHWQAFSALHAQFLDSMQGMSTLKAFNAIGRRRSMLHRDAQEVYRRTMSQLAASMIGNGVVGLSISAGTAAAVALGAVKMTGEQIDIASLLVILFLAGECFRPMADLNNFWHLGYQGLSVSADIVALRDAQPDVTEADPKVMSAASTRIDKQLEAGGKELSVEFRDVTFQYEAGKPPVLRGIELDIRPGETIALVGRSGAGKSTAMHLLQRFYDPQAGSIRIGGIDIRELPLRKLRELLSVVWQDTYLFNGTIEQNLRIAKPDASMEQLTSAATAARIHAFIESLPNGYGTVVGERGVRLSGGERQRIAIARAFLKDSPILLLDEATSNVDIAAETAIQQSLEKLRLGRTTIVIAHRLSTVRSADRIFVLDSGEVVESGTHDELYAKGGRYARLVAVQEEAERLGAASVTVS